MLFLVPPIDRRVYRSGQGKIPRSRDGTGPCLGLLAVGVSTVVDHTPRAGSRIAAVLADLPASWANVRKVLNELQAIVG